MKRTMRCEAESLEMSMEADLIIAGSGVAGLSAALQAVRLGARVTLLTARSLLAGSSPAAQGGVAAAVGDDDAPELHAADTLAVGAGLNDATAVGLLTRSGRDAARDLIAAGVPFDRGPAGVDLGLEAGHRRRRILHAGGGATGRAVTETLLAQVIEHPLVRVLPHSPADELLLEDDRVIGVRSGERCWYGRAVILATGGYAALWGRTTNSPESRGSGLALAYRAGAALADLEFVQFHPTALVLPDRPAFLLTEALRGEGARLVNDAGASIVDPLLPRDIVARAVARYRRDHGAVYLSLREQDATFIRERFPNIATQLRAWGLDLARDLLPVAPAAHYCMGGVRSDGEGRTDLPGLYVAGEVACTGVQGANRLASNSLLECLVFGRRAAETALHDAPGARGSWSVASLTAVEDQRQTTPARTREAIAARLERDCGVERNATDLQGLIGDLPDPAIDATSDEGVIATLVARSALLRQESRGAHYRTDAPETDLRWRGRIHWRRDAQTGQPLSYFEELA